MSDRRQSGLKTDSTFQQARASDVDDADSLAFPDVFHSLLGAKD